MATKPTEKPTWANTDVNDPITNAPNKKKPSSELQDSGLLRKQPFFRNHLNWLFDNIAKWIDYLDTVNSTISEDTTIYVATTGNDITGDGTILNPFATPQRALNSLIGVPIATTALVTIFCAAGTYVLDEPVKLNHPYGERIHIIGDNLTSVKPSRAPIADWSSDKNNPTVPTRGLSQFYNTAGTLPVNSDSTTRRAAVSSDLVNNITLVENSYSTIFQFNGVSGIVVDGNNSLGKIDKVVIKGDWDGVFNAPVNAKIGIDIGKSAELLGYGTSVNTTGGTIFLGKDTVIIGWHGEGARIRYNGSMTCEDGVSVVNNYNNGVRVEATSSLSANLSSIVGNGRHGVFTTGTSVSYLAGSLCTGNVNSGCQSAIGSSSVIRDFTSCGNGSAGVIVTVGSSVSFDNGTSKGNGGDGLSTITGSSCDGDNVIVSDNNGKGLSSVSSSVINGSGMIVKNNERGVFTEDNGSVLLASGEISENSLLDVSCNRNSYTRLSSVTVPSGSTVTATKRSYIFTASQTGVVYTPAHGSTGADGSLIDD